MHANRYLRSCGNRADLSELDADTYLTFSICLQNHGNGSFQWEQAHVQVDDGKICRWPRGQVAPASRVRLYIANKHMKQFLTPGTHEVTWYFDGQAVHKQRFVLTDNMQWDTVFPCPSAAQIASYRNPKRYRSPYIAGWLDILPETRYTEYSIDFRAAHLPRGTYCCLGGWKMDHSHMEKLFKTVRLESGGIHAYAGFQRLQDGTMVSIMSFWDVFCQDALGRETMIRAKRLHPATTVGSDSFWGEGNGARCIAPYAWKADHWYRMHLKSMVSRDTGMTIVEQWVSDLETGESTMLCRYDTGIVNSSFRGSIAIFLENFQPETAGEIRSMEVRNAKFRNADTKQWEQLQSVYVTAQSDEPKTEGSYNFGVSGDRIWMITSGVGGDWYHNGKGKQGTYFTLSTKE